MFNNLALWGEKKFVSELKRTYKFQRGVNNRLDCHANQTRILSNEYSFVAGDYVRSTARNDVKPHTEDNIPKYRMVGKIYHCLTNVDKRLRNKCAIVCDLFTRPFGERVRERGYLAASLLSRLAAFTLAEVLITLGIIGVVAAMTMPSLITAKQEKATISIIKKNYSIFANALLMAQNDNGELYTWGITKDADGLNLVSSNLKPYLKIIEDCGVGEKSDCAPGDNGKFKDLTGRKRTEDFSSSDYYSFRLNDGTAVAIQLKTKAECISFESSCMNFYIDTNGKKYPNTLGKDIFYFAGYGNGKLRAAGINHSPSETGWAAREGWYTTAWAMYKENLDYLRCPDKLEWNGKSTCK